MTTRTTLISAGPATRNAVVGLFPIRQFRKEGTATSSRSNHGAVCAVDRRTTNLGLRHGGSREGDQRWPGNWRGAGRGGRPLSVGVGVAAIICFYVTAQRGWRRRQLGMTQPWRHHCQSRRVSKGSCLPAGLAADSRQPRRPSGSGLSNSNEAIERQGTVAVGCWRNVRGEGSRWPLPPFSSCAASLVDGRRRLP